MEICSQQPVMNKKRKGIELPPPPPPQPVTLTRLPTRIRAPPLLVSHLTAEQRMRREKTFMSATTNTGKALENLYHDVVEISQCDIDAVLDTVETFIYAIKHRINKNRHNIKFGEPFIGGRAVTGTATKASFKDLKLYMPLKFKETRPKIEKTGYSSVHMSRNPSFDRYQSIRSDESKNFVSPLKVSRAVHEILTHICQSTGRGETRPFYSNSSPYGEGSHHIIVQLEDDVRLTATPCLYPKVSKRDDDGTMLVTTPYQFDDDPTTDQLWRFDNPSHTKSMQEAMNKADRKTRSKALRLAYACHEVDPVLRLCPPEFIDMTLYGMFDSDIDDLPEWQTVDLESCFTSLLTNWLQHMKSNHLSHPFQKRLNVLNNMAESDQLQVKNRLTRLISNKRELLRLLQQRN